MPQTSGVAELAEQRGHAARDKAARSRSIRLWSAWRSASRTAQRIRQEGGAQRGWGMCGSDAVLCRRPGPPPSRRSWLSPCVLGRVRAASKRAQWM
jgi:hypothetical protein